MSNAARAVFLAAYNREAAIMDRVFNAPAPLASREKAAPEAGGDDGAKAGNRADRRKAEQERKRTVRAARKLAAKFRRYVEQRNTPYAREIIARRREIADRVILPTFEKFAALAGVPTPAGGAVVTFDPPTA